MSNPPRAVDEELHRTISSLLVAQAQTHPDRPAVYDGVRKLTYDQLLQASNAFAHALRTNGLERGERLCVIAPPSLETLIAMYGCARAGVVYCPIPTRFTVPEVSRSLDALSARAAYVGEREQQLWTDVGAPLRRIVVDPDARDPHWTESDTAPEDVCWIMWTSGSTSFPKAARIPERSAVGSGLAYSSALATTADDSWLNFFPLFHVGGLTHVVLHCLVTAAKLRLMPSGFDPTEAIKIIREERITRCGGNDVFWNKMRASSEWPSADFTSVTAATIAGNLQTYDHVEALGIPLIGTAYASTEAGPAAVTPISERHRDIRKSGNGKPSGEMSIGIVDPESGDPLPRGEPGEIVVKGPLLFSGYDNEDGPPLDADGYFHTGDRGYLDGEGTLFYRGRFKQMIKTGGENVAAAEVQMALESVSPDICSAQVVGAPDSEWGEAVIAFIEMVPGATLDSAHVKAQLRSSLASFKIPKKMVQVEAGCWPVTPSGKVDRRELERLAASDANSGVA